MCRRKPINNSSKAKYDRIIAPIKPSKIGQKAIEKVNFTAKLLEYNDGCEYEECSLDDHLTLDYYGASSIGATNNNIEGRQTIQYLTLSNSRASMPFYHT